ncbi:hypothetical protein GALMADRAFT_266152 [Galerina marginata CBS 339.88]|uniref:Uncharacterized protein n=1 Tax=Galerina marginata (strain CBS 339.88) TaxID=685588 RepID=A0A067TFM5_GALM3|nr:hypothetical protein GALMADRAFT_266152 [Galerina marginata CBS 339.88]
MTTDMAAKSPILPEEDGATLDWDALPFQKVYTVQLFGLEGLTADLFTYQGKYPTFFLAEDPSPVYQLAAFRHDLRLSALLPDVAKTPLDQFVFANVMLTRQSFDIPGGYGAGLHFEAELQLDETCGELHGVLSQVLGVKDPALHLHCGLSLIQDWKEPLHVNSFTLEGTFREILIPTPCKGVTMTSIGVRVLGFEKRSYKKDGSLLLGTDYGFEVFGTLQLECQAWKGPVELAYEISKMSSALSLSATVIFDWKDAFGIPKLTLQDIGVQAEVMLDKPLSATTFSVSATLRAGRNVLSLFGSFSLEGDCSFGATLENLDWDGLMDIYEHFFDERIPAPDVRLELRRATISISNKGFMIDIERLEISDFPPASGTLEIGRHGFFLHAELDGKAVTIDDVQLSNPLIEISCNRANGSTKTDVIVSGDFSWQGFALKIGVHLYPSPDDNDQSLEYTICGEFMIKDLESGLRFDKVVPALKHCSLGGLTLDGAALIVASRDDPDLPASMTAKYPIRQGFFVCAVIGHLEVLSTLMGGNHPQLSLAAGWEKDIGFMLAMKADNLVIDLSEGVKTDPFELKVVLSNNPALHLCCGISVEVANQLPLRFLLDCALEPKGGAITLTGAMVGMWENPFGLSQQLKIGNMILSVTILAAGTPSGFGIAGEIVSGKTKLQVKLFVNNDPSKSLVHVNVENLGVKEITEVVSTLVGYDLPQPPDVIRFEKVELYACPAGAIILGKAYPRGFCFYSKMIIFGKLAEVKVVIGDGGVEIEGSVEAFTLGPLTVTGNKEGKASLSAALTRSKQSGKIDGVITFADMRIELYANFELQPSFTFAFHFLLRVENVFFINVNAGPESGLQPSSCDISSKRYILEADFQAPSLARVRQQISDKIREAAAALEAEAEQLLQKIENEKRHFRETVYSARQGLDRWAQQKNIDHSEQQRLMESLAWVVEENIRLNPESIPHDAANTFQRELQELRDARAQFEKVKGTTPQEIQIINKFTVIPVRTIFEFARSVAQVTVPGLRDEFKQAEIRYLRAQVQVTELVMDLVPDDLSNALDPYVRKLHQKLFNEQRNGPLEDLFEEIGDFLEDIISAIADLMLSIIDVVGGLLFDVARGVVQRTNDAIQATLRFANGALTSLLSLLEIRSIHMKGSLGGGSDGLSFEASIEGFLRGKYFQFSVSFHIKNFWSFIQAMFAWLLDYLKKQII